MKTFDMLVTGGTLVTPAGQIRADLGVTGGKIVDIGDLGSASAGETIDAKGLHVLPGVIDTQVHFRDPGLTHKEDLETGSHAAALGGVTAVFEMPNTKPPTTTEAAMAAKVARGREVMQCDFAFFMGGTAENAGDLSALERLPGVCGVKIFMGSSTGNLLVKDDETIAAVLAHGRRRVAVHSEDEFRLLERRKEAKVGEVATHPVWRDVEAAMTSTKRLIRLSKEANRAVHLLHVSTAEEMDLIWPHKDLITVETTPQHLTLEAPEAYDRLGTKAQMNPPIRDAHARAGIWRGVTLGIVDVLGSDHAPHTVEEKARTYPTSPSGMPGVQTLVPVMLNHVNAGRLSLERFVDLMCHGPQRIFGIAGKGRLVVGYDADLTLVDMKATREVTAEWLASRCGWSPFEGEHLTGWPMGTIIRGTRVMADGTLTGAAFEAAPVRFVGY